MRKVLRSWIHSSNDFYNESFPPDPDSDEDEDEDDEGGSTETDWMKMWALCVSSGIPDSQWEHMTIPKIRALRLEKNKKQEFEILLHDKQIENKRPKKAKFLSDLGFYQK